MEPDRTPGQDRRAGGRPSRPRGGAERHLPALAEVFRTHGYEGASLALITGATGLGKGSLYALFPGGKPQMAAAVLASVEAWFAASVFAPLRDLPPKQGIPAMFAATEAYFHAGGRVCIVGAFALGAERDVFAAAIAGYFRGWQAALAGALGRAGHPAPEPLAEAILAGIQGGLVLARANGDPSLFPRLLRRLQAEALRR